MNKELFTSKLQSRNTKLKLYNRVIKPVVKHACETWVMKSKLNRKY